MRRRLRAGYFFALLLPILFCGVLLLLLRPWEIGYDNRSIPRDSTLGFTEAFAWTLMENRVDIAKKIVHESQWPRLEQWEKEHKAVGCDRWVHFPNEWTTSMVGDGIKGPDGQSLDDDPPWPVGTTASFGFELWWPCPGGDYQMDFDVELIWTEKGWLVVDWGEVSEREFR